MAAFNISGFTDITITIDDSTGNVTATGYSGTANDLFTYDTTNKKITVKKAAVNLMFEQGVTTLSTTGVTNNFVLESDVKLLNQEVTLTSKAFTNNWQAVTDTSGNFDYYSGSVGYSASSSTNKKTGVTTYTFDLEAPTKQFTISGLSNVTKNNLIEANIAVNENSGEVTVKQGLINALNLTNGSTATINLTDSDYTLKLDTGIATSASSSGTTGWDSADSNKYTLAGTNAYSELSNNDTTITCHGAIESQSFTFTGLGNNTNISPQLFGKELQVTVTSSNLQNQAVTVTKPEGYTVKFVLGTGVTESSAGNNASTFLGSTNGFSFTVPTSTAGYYISGETIQYNSTEDAGGSFTINGLGYLSSATVNAAGQLKLNGVTIGTVTKTSAGFTVTLNASALPEASRTTITASSTTNTNISLSLSGINAAEDHSSATLTKNNDNYTYTGAYKEAGFENISASGATTATLTYNSTETPHASFTISGLSGVTADGDGNVSNIDSYLTVTENDAGDGYDVKVLSSALGATITLANTDDKTYALSVDSSDNIKTEAFTQNAEGSFTNGKFTTPSYFADCVSDFV